MPAIYATLQGGAQFEPDAYNAFKVKPLMDIREQCPDVKQLCRLLGDLGHEVATPLASILLASEMLADNTQGNLTDRQVRSLHNVIQAAGEVQHLMKRVVLLTRLTTGQIEPEKRAFPLEALVEEVGAAHPAVKLEVLAPLPESYENDRMRLRELLDTMVEFALRSDGEPELQVASWPTGVLTFTVQARGVLSQGQLAQALDPFESGLKAARLGGGPGLELAVASRLAALLGGRFEVVDRQDGKIALGAIFPTG